MNSVSETVLNTSSDEVEAARQEPRTELDADLVELGKVSNTQGGIFGWKTDVGSGFITY